MEDDSNVPQLSSYRPQRRFLPKPPGPSRGPSKAERQRAARIEARDERLHLAGMTNAGTIVMGVVLAVVVVMLLVILMSHH
jgi:hypothetical protein